jgi:hypothetical protein
MRFVLVHCENPNSSDAIYSKLAKACIKSIEKNAKGAEIIEATTNVKHHTDWMRYANNLKLKIWLDNLKGDTVFIDADTIILDDISGGFQKDLTYTKRHNKDTKIPFNSGVVFVKESGKDILEKWLEIDSQMAKDKKLWYKWQKVAFGYNQASFAALLVAGKFEGRISHVPSYIYNSCDPSDWNFKHDQAKLVHVKARLRDSLFRNKNNFAILQKIKPYYT